MKCTALTDYRIYNNLDKYAKLTNHVIQCSNQVSKYFVRDKLYKIETYQCCDKCFSNFRVNYYIVDQLYFKQISLKEYEQYNSVKILA